LHSDANFYPANLIPLEEMATSTSSKADGSPITFRPCSNKLTDLNFVTWRYDMSNLLSYSNLNQYLKEPTDAIKNHPDDLVKLKQVTT
jgi:hypothetical protein